MRLPPLALSVLCVLGLECVTLPSIAAEPTRETERAGTTSARDRWENAYRERLGWWSLQPVQSHNPPPVRNAGWSRNEIDRFVLARLEQADLHPAPEADRRVLARRLSFALTGLPPSPDQVERFQNDTRPDAYGHLVAEFLASPHFGEHWARHWLDVVHYSDTHGYEWDTPAKHAWRYRDYLTRAFNRDVPFRRLILEQLAGDLLDPRIDPESGINESLIGPMALRLGERRHGDNAAAEGVTQEAIANIIDTVSKGFLATTVACAQCHDHKLDAVEQRDFYGLAGLFMNTRWSVRCLEVADPNLPVIEELRALKHNLRAELVRLWTGSPETLTAAIRATPLPAETNRVANTNTPAPFPENLKNWWVRSQTHPLSPEEFTREREHRIARNRTNLVLLADFTREESAANGWRWEGWGMQHGLVRDGESVIAEDGDLAVLHLLPAGRWSHVWSSRLAGAIRSPLLSCDPPFVFSAQMVAGRFAAEAFIIDHAFHSERMQFPDLAVPRWRTLKAGAFDTLEGGLDKSPRRVYLEWATKALNNYFPPRTGYGGVKESEIENESSWFGVSRIYRHAEGQPPLDELARFAPLHRTDAVAANRDPATNLTRLLLAAAERWGRDQADSDDVHLLNDALTTGWLPRHLKASPELERLVQRYRTTAARLRPDRTIGSVAEWNEGQDEKIGVRGSYTTLGAVVPRGNIRFLGGPAPRQANAAAGRLEFAQNIADDRNPLTARVFVNRVWHYLFGAGLVRTPDDFGHLGEKPSHPELLDYLASRFTAEGWSLKRLVTLMVSSATWRQSDQPSAQAQERDPENRLWHHRPMRRLEAEAIRDAILVVSGRWDPTLFGPPLHPHRTAEDAAKRLFSGPLDGLGRRSLYLNATLMEPPRFLALFNQPIPKLTTGRRDVTSVPDQALALLNDPFVHTLAKHWSTRVSTDGASTPDRRARAMFAQATGRPPTPEETDRLVAYAARSAAQHGTPTNQVLQCQPAWQDLAHALFNLKEFIHVR